MRSEGMLQPKLFELLFSRYLHRTALKLWSEKQTVPALDSKNIHIILESTWSIYHSQARQMPKQANLGNWLVMQFAFVTLSAYQAMRDFGLSEETAIGLIQDLTWQITSTWTRRAKRVSTPLFRSQQRQLKFFVERIMKTLFSAPAYQFKMGELENGFYLDVLQCPVAELMKSKGVPDLCIKSWCGVDFGLVDILGGELVRTGTIAMGKGKCDFRFFPVQ